MRAPALAHMFAGMPTLRLHRTNADARTGATLELGPEAAVVDATASARRHVSTPRAVLAVAVLGCFMAFVDATIVNIAVPSIARHFSARGLSSVSWVLNAYNIVFAAFLVGGGQLADLLGRRRVFSVPCCCSRSPRRCARSSSSLTMLIAARAVQAAGAAALVPSSLAIVLEAHDARRRMHAVALWSAVAALAAGIGPPLGGLLITASSWRLVFLVNIPVGLVAFLLAGRVLVESRAPGRRRDARPARRRRARAGDRIARAGRREGAGMGLEQRARAGSVRGSAAAGRLLRDPLEPPAHAGRRPVDVPDSRVRAVQRRDGRDGQRLLRVHALQRAVPDDRLALLDPRRRPGADAGAVRGDRRRRSGQPAGGARRSPPRRRAGRARVGRRHGLLRHAARHATRLPRRVAAGHGRARDRRGSDVPDLERRRGRARFPARDSRSRPR